MILAFKFDAAPCPTAKKIPQIARELNVAFVLEGSVQRAGNMVHITGQLIRAATDEHLWAKSYDRELTAANIFGIQAELAQAIAGELRAAISPQEKALLQHRPTENLAAYDLVLKARQWINLPSVRSRELQESRRLLQSAVRLDPNYALAYADLATSYVVAGLNFLPPAADLANAKEAIAAATRIAPSSPDVVRALGDFYYYGYHDYGLALEQYERFAQLRPNDPIYYNRLGAIQRRQSRWAESLASWRKLEDLEPGNLRNRRDIAVLLAVGRRFDEAIAQQRRVVERAPDDLRASFELAELPYVASGSTREMEQLLARLTPAQLDSASGIVGIAPRRSRRG